MSNNQLSVFNRESFVISTSKTGAIKTGSLAMFVAFGSKAEREKMGVEIYVNQVANGMYRPIARDIIETLVPKSAQSFLSVGLDDKGPMNKVAFQTLCTQVEYATRAKASTFKGKKFYLLNIVNAVVNQMNIAEGKGEVVA
jgi:hypothetical protein